MADMNPLKEGPIPSDDNRRKCIPRSTVTNTGAQDTAHQFLEPTILNPKELRQFASLSHNSQHDTEPSHTVM